MSSFGSFKRLILSGMKLTAFFMNWSLHDIDLHDCSKQNTAVLLKDMQLFYSGFKGNTFSAKFSKNT